MSKVGGEFYAWCQASDIENLNYITMKQKSECVL